MNWFSGVIILMSLNPFIFDSLYLWILISLNPYIFEFCWSNSLSLTSERFAISDWKDMGLRQIWVCSKNLVPLLCRSKKNLLYVWNVQSEMSLKFPFYKMSFYKMSQNLKNIKKCLFSFWKFLICDWGFKVQIN